MEPPSDLYSDIHSTQWYILLFQFNLWTCEYLVLHYGTDYWSWFLLVLHLYGTGHRYLHYSYIVLHVYGTDCGWLLFNDDLWTAYLNFSFLILLGHLWWTIMDSTGLLWEMIFIGWIWTILFRTEDNPIQTFTYQIHLIHTLYQCTNISEDIYILCQC